jgi:hypothetical protein
MREMGNRIGTVQGSVATAAQGTTDDNIKFFIRLRINNK